MKLLPPPDALLFDLDGVLADVSRSYRQAIVDTAATFDVTIEAARVGAAKAAGNANNDWVVTQRLLAEHGTKVPLTEVRKRFEALYHGTPEQPGLWRTERLVTDRALLGRLAERLPLGVVTGRPRADADRFLHLTDIAGYFVAVVCMEDAPAKPDPAPVRLLLERMAVKRAWLVGDTPDDMRAAIAADVVPIGLVALGDDVATTTISLQRAGAVRILGALEELEKLLP